MPLNNYSSDEDAIDNEMIFSKILEIAKKQEQLHQQSMVLIEKQGMCVESLLQRVSSYENELNTLKSTCQKLQEELSFLKTNNDEQNKIQNNRPVEVQPEFSQKYGIPELNNNLADFQKLSDLSNTIDKVVITGVPNLSNSKSELTSIAQSIFDSIKVQINPGDIVDVSLKKNNKNTLKRKKIKTDRKSENSSKDDYCLNNLVVTMKNNSQVRTIIDAKRKHRTLEFCQLDTKKLSHVPVLTTSPNSVINVNEFLPRSQYKLFQKSFKLLKSIGFEKVWKQQYCIYARLSTNYPVHMILDEKQLMRVHDVYNPS